MSRYSKTALRKGTTPAAVAEKSTPKREAAEASQAEQAFLFELPVSAPRKPVPQQGPSHTA